MTHPLYAVKFCKRNTMSAWVIDLDHRRTIDVFPLETYILSALAPLKLFADIEIAISEYYQSYLTIYVAV